MAYKILVLSLACSVIVSSNAQFDGETVKFKLSATNLPNGDLDGPSDPYVSFYAATRRITDNHRHWQFVGRTSTKQDTLNPVWDETFQFQYINGTEQTWRFFVRDEDQSWYNPIFAIDEPLGHVDVNVQSFIVEMRKVKQQRINGSEPVKAIQTFLAYPTGGTLLITPVTE